MPGIAILNWENAIKSMIGLGPADATEVARGESLFIDAARILDDHLTDNHWICQSGLSLADFAIAAPLADQDQARLPVAGFANLQRWLNEVQSLEAWKNTQS